MFKRLHLIGATAALVVQQPAFAQFTPEQPVTGPITVRSRPGNPLTDMPKGQTLVSPFGERPVFSPDGKKIAFISDSYGDAFEYDIATGKIRNLTAHMAHRGFLRIHYLHDGSYLLLGPRLRGKTNSETRESHIELFWMGRNGDTPPVALGVTVFEGIATSSISNQVAWGEIVPEKAGLRDAKGVKIKTAQVVVTGNSARLERQAEVGTFSECMAEAQDFLPGDKGLTMPCYHFGMQDGQLPTDVLSVDFATRAVTKYPTPAGLYTEIEGLFPGGRKSLVECSSERTAGMDLCILQLDPKDSRLTRLTHIMDFGRWKYGNPVVSPDGRHIAASIGPADVPEPGMALGIVLIDLPASP